ncbi:TadE/TadG family type IV pilus assembly protein [Hafnia paralvei]|uniref:TadE/TadG family type IV pilus assembly protein n=1 Tax=Hafnia paralvei TaxID=546367 RepID=UPI0010343072|nr:TadE family protein [Hafnia paralvei]TBL99657.1 pilus assembly protein [Hafnia paralvei]TBM23761.1 pilus assembly protein [Hafnia paralvei]
MALRKCFIRDNEGAASIEFSLTVILFIFLVLFVAEIARLSYISAVIDLAVSEAAKESKNASAVDDGGYDNRFQKRITEQGGAIWGFLTRPDAVTMNITYAGSIREMTDTGGTSGDSRYKPLARYQLEYQYHPMFFPFPDIWANNLLNREVIFVQEYERSKFMD